MADYRPPSWMVGHRGARAIRLENSSVGFQWAADNRVPAIELDVRLSADGVPVLSHDPTLLRLFGRAEPVSSLVASELAAVMPDRTAIIGLEPALDILHGKCGVFVELKSDRRDGIGDGDAAEEVASLLDARSQRGTRDLIVAVSSFDPKTVARFMQASRNFAHLGALLTDHKQIALFELFRARRQRLQQLHPHYSAVLREPWVPAIARLLGVSVTCYTVNNPVVSRLLRILGVARVISDDPYMLDPRRDRHK